MPYLDESVILGGAHFPAVGVVDSLRAGTLMRESAQQAGALTVLAGTEVHGISVDGGRVRSVTTSAGEIETENVVICCGVWSPRIAAMAGARLALTPVVHQMISVGPIALFAGTPGAPILARADYAVIGDLHQIIPALIQALRERVREGRPPVLRLGAIRIRASSPGVLA